MSETKHTRSAIFHYVRVAFAVLLFAGTPYILYNPLLPDVNRAGTLAHSYLMLSVPSFVLLLWTTYRYYLTRDWLTGIVLAIGILFTLAPLPLLWLFHHDASCRFYRGDHSVNMEQYDEYYFDNGFYYVELGDFLEVKRIEYGKWEIQNDHVQLTPIYPTGRRTRALCRSEGEVLLTTSDRGEQYEFHVSHPADTALIPICPKTEMPKAEYAVHKKEIEGISKQYSEANMREAWLQEDRDYFLQYIAWVAAETLPEEDFIHELHKLRFVLNFDFNLYDPYYGNDDAPEVRASQRRNMPYLYKVYVQSPRMFQPYAPNDRYFLTWYEEVYSDSIFDMRANGDAFWRERIDSAYKYRM